MKVMHLKFTVFIPILKNARVWFWLRQFGCEVATVFQYFLLIVFLITVQENPFCRIFDLLLYCSFSCIYSIISPVP